MTKTMYISSRLIENEFFFYGKRNRFLPKTRNNLYKSFLIFGEATTRFLIHRFLKKNRVPAKFQGQTLMGNRVYKNRHYDVISAKYDPPNLNSAQIVYRLPFTHMPSFQVSPAGNRISKNRLCHNYDASSTKFGP